MGTAEEEGGGASPSEGRKEAAPAESAGVSDAEFAPPAALLAGEFWFELVLVGFDMMVGCALSLVPSTGSYKKAG